MDVSIKIMCVAEINYVFTSEIIIIQKSAATRNWQLAIPFHIIGWAHYIMNLKTRSLEIGAEVNLDTDNLIQITRQKVR